MHYCIVGAGLVGALTAKILVDEGINPSQIAIHETSHLLMPAWRNSDFGSYQALAGFHGFEMPRCEETVSLLSSLCTSSILHSYPTKRFLNIGSFIVPYSSPLDQWPADLSDGLSHDLERFSNPDSVIVNPSSYLFSHILNCFRRYNEDLKDAFPLFYPWFFPREYSFDPNSQDEGHRYQQQIRDLKLTPYYLSPSSFPQLADELFSALLQLGVSVHTGSNGLRLLEDESKSKILWTTNAYPLLNSVGKVVDGSTRYLSSFLFSIDKPPFINQSTFSEILVVNSRAPWLYRVSAASNIYNQFQLLAECISLTEEEPQVDSIHMVLKQIFPDYHFGYMGKTLPRQVKRFSDTDLRLMSAALEEITAANPRLIVAGPSWGPLNMAKAAPLARSVVDSCKS